MSITCSIYIDIIPVYYTTSCTYSCTSDLVLLEGRISIYNWHGARHDFITAWCAIFPASPQSATLLLSDCFQPRTAAQRPEGVSSSPFNETSKGVVCMAIGVCDVPHLQITTWPSLLWTTCRWKYPPSGKHLQWGQMRWRHSRRCAIAYTICT